MISLAYFLAGFFLVAGIIATGYVVHERTKKTISVSEFRKRLKKLLE